MTEVSVYNMKGEILRKISLDERVFALAKNDVLLKEVYTSISANERGVYAHTKGRGERHGSGKKPWKQKHTGRARAGSVRSPLWRKGGVVFGPKRDRNFTKKINQKARRKAVMVALSEKLRSNDIFVLDSFTLSEYKTKHVASTLAALNVVGKSILLGFTSNEKMIERAGRNIQKLSPVSIHVVNVKSLLDHRFLIVSEESIRELEKRFIVAE